MTAVEVDGHWFDAGVWAARSGELISASPWPANDHGLEARSWRNGWLQMRARNAIVGHPRPEHREFVARAARLGADPTSILDDEWPPVWATGWIDPKNTPRPDPTSILDEEVLPDAVIMIGRLRRQHDWLEPARKEAVR